MCILIHHTANTSFSDEVLRDFYSHNPDGFGLMFGDGQKIHVTKSLGSVDETIALYRDIAEGRECIIHYRMKTHGNIDTANCHPYRITDELWLAHNGILSAGNPIRKEMSDTWHMIEYILRPIAESNMDMLFTEDFQEYLGDLIGSSNKFALCHADGRIAVINREAGVEHFGAWLSNTYAWSASKHGFYHKGVSNRYNSYFDYYDGYDNVYVGNITPKTQTQAQTQEPLYDQYDYDEVVRSAYKCWLKGEKNLLNWIEYNPEKAKCLIVEWYDMEPEEIDQLVYENPEEAFDWIADLFKSDSVPAQEV
jgi:hypothetical protein